MEALGEWVELDREVIFEKYTRRIEKVRFRLPDGSVSDYYLKNEGATAGVLALTADNQVILIQQFRPGPNKILLELPGGYIDPKEGSETAAARELLEETGYIGNLMPSGTFFDCAYSNRVRHYFLATDCIRASRPKVTASESGRVRFLSLSQFAEHLRAGHLTDAAGGYAGLDCLARLGRWAGELKRMAA